MMQAIGALERAISKLERNMATLEEAVTAAATAPPPPLMDREAARAALRSLDDLIAELRSAEPGDANRG
ncbi:hypothetical protein WG907_13275 [Sphingobium sp. AN558]|uniref:hypothetical protein n=1 Tax=Sphingobium sp. AN558 TaxID=3133442 RepID=UPI0030C0CA87